MDKIDDYFKKHKPEQMLRLRKHIWNHSLPLVSLQTIMLYPKTFFTPIIKYKAYERHLYTSRNCQLAAI